MSEANGTQQQTQATTISQADYEKAKSQADNFYAKNVDLQKQLDRFKGIDPDRVKALEEEVDNYKRDGATGDRKKIDELIARKESEISERFSGKLTEAQKHTEQLTRELNDLRVVSVAMKEAAAIFNDDALELIEAKVRQLCDWQDGRIVVKGDDGKARYSKANPRELMGVSELMAELAGKYTSCAKATAVGGGKTAGTKSTPSPKQFDVNAFKGMSKDEQIKFMNENPDIRAQVFANRK